MHHLHHLRHLRRPEQVRDARWNGTVVGLTARVKERVVELGAGKRGGEHRSGVYHDPHAGGQAGQAAGGADPGYGMPKKNSSQSRIPRTLRS